MLCHPCTSSHYTHRPVRRQSGVLAVQLPQAAPLVSAVAQHQRQRQAQHPTAGGRKCRSKGRNRNTNIRGKRRTCWWSLRKASARVQAQGVPVHQRYMRTRGRCACWDCKAPLARLFTGVTALAQYWYGHCSCRPAVTATQAEPHAPYGVCEGGKSHTDSVPGGWWRREQLQGRYVAVGGQGHAQRVRDARLRRLRAGKRRSGGGGDGECEDQRRSVQP